MARRIVAEFDAVTGPFLQKMDRIDASINRFERGTITKFGNVERGVNTLVASGRRLQNVSNLLAAGFGVNIAARFIDEAKLIRNALREAGDSSQETFEKVFQSSVRALAGFRDTAQGVQRFQKALRDTQGIEDSIRQVETLNKLLALSGKTTQERASTFIQFTQALQAGYLGGEELRAVRENAPIELVRAISQAAGGTIEDLKDLAAEGKLTRDVMVAALKSLEEEADRRLGKVQVTITDAAQIFRSGAIVATEGFDSGLGLSRTTVDALTGVGKVLGESGEAFERFGQAVKVAGALLITSFAGRRITTVVGNVQGLSRSLYAAAAAAEAETAAAGRSLAAARAREAARLSTLNSLIAEGAATSRITRAQKSYDSAAKNLARTHIAYSAAVTATTAAQQRLLLSSRLLTGAMGALRGAFAFLGGVPGIILTAAAAFTILRANTETTADALERAQNVDTSGLDASASKAKELREEWQRLRKELGQGADLSPLLQNLRTEFGAAQDQAQQELIDSQDDYEAFLASYQGQIERERDLTDELERIRTYRAQLSVDAERLADPANPVPDRLNRLAEVNRLISLADQDVARISGALDNADANAAQFGRTMDSLAVSIQGAAEVIGGSIEDLPADLVAAERAALATIEATTSEQEKQRAVIAGLEQSYALLADRVGENVPLVTRFRAAIDKMKAELSGARSESDLLSDSVARLGAALAKIGSVNLGLEARLATVRAQIAAAEAGASEVRVRALPSARDAAAEALGAGASADQVAAIYSERLRLTEETLTAEERLSELLSGGGGGGGGSSARAEENDILKEAASLIEQTMTAEERRAGEIQKAINLRKQLAATYGEENALVQQVSEAVRRLQDEYVGAGEEQRKFFDTLSDELAGAIENWEGFGNVVRSILASLVREYGVDFFTSLLSPGTGSGVGGSLGTGLSNFVGGLFGGASQNIATVSSAKTAQSFSAGAKSGVVLTMNNDFRGADPSTQAAMEAKVDQLRAEFPGMWIETAREVKQARIQL